MVDEVESLGEVEEYSKHFSLLVEGGTPVVEGLYDGIMCAPAREEAVLVVRPDSVTSE